MNKLFSILLLVLLSSTQIHAQRIVTQAENALLMDAGSGDILFAKNADDRFAPASLTKLMTIYIAFQELKANNLRLDDTTIVSAGAWRNWNNRGSTMYLNHKDEVTIEQLLRGIIVLSGNDACVVLGEHISATHDIFVQEMNNTALKLGMKNTHFKNANGWPVEDQYTSAKDMAILAERLITDFPEYYPMFAERSFLYKNFTSNTRNRNPLFGAFPVPGADGLKTGGDPGANEYGIVASAMQDGRRMIMVLGKLPSASARGRETQRMFNIGFRQFKSYPLFKKGERVDTAEVWLGQELTVPMVIDEDITLTMSRGQRARMRVSVKFMNPVSAPLTKGQTIGKLTISMPEKADLVYDLKSGASIETVGGFGKIGAALEYLLFGSAGAETSSK